jgi:transcriptional regulator with XRE-family HTH domain
MSERPCSSCGRVEQLRRGLCHADYERDRRAGRIEPLVSAKAARYHIAVLCWANGWRYREVARAAGVDRSVVAWIMARGRQRITAKTAQRICAIDPATRDQYFVTGWDDERRATQRYPKWSEERRREQPVKAWAARRANEQERQRQVRVAIPKPPEWVRDALCAQIDQEMFFPEKGSNSREAKRICLGCEVREKCLEFALEHDIDYGVFGGLSVKERKQIQRTRAQEAAITG